MVEVAQRQRTRFPGRSGRKPRGSKSDFYKSRPARDERFGGNMEASNNARARGIMNEELLDRVIQDRIMRREAEKYRNQMLREDYAIANTRRGNPNMGFYDFNPDVMARQFNNPQAGKLAEIYNQ